MGNAATRDSIGSDEFRRGVSQFTASELTVLRSTFNELSERSPGTTIDKHTFLKAFPWPGLLGERLFDMFDTKKTGAVDYEEFIVGLARVCRGSVDDRMRFIFEVHDLSGDGSVSRAELRTLLHHLPRPVLRSVTHSGRKEAASKPAPEARGRAGRSGATELRIIAAEHAAAAGSARPRGGMDTPLSEASDSDPPSDACCPADASTGYNSDGAFTPCESTRSAADTPRSGASALGPPRGAPALAATPREVARSEAREARDLRTASRLVRSSERWVSELVDRAFRECGVRGDESARLGFEAFKRWLHDAPEVMAFLEAVFPYSSDKGDDAHALPGEAGRRAHQLAIVGASSGDSDDADEDHVTFGGESDGGSSADPSADGTDDAGRRSLGGGSYRSDETGFGSNNTLAPPLQNLLEDQRLPASMAAFHDGDDLDALWEGHEFADDDVNTTDTEDCTDSGDSSEADVVGGGAEAAARQPLGR
ncbi:hypothetical protein FNF28_05666 [Cafeteria roenbergensis]|uniref:EF-hand domain-containing protein n=1 Tax=Cafeteria roenbergensis TaxID=33653 RepID=A0A5A8D2W6_CAFRO|nr:hypothetical protein FNF28_05666 [Cafeteria roenbergensis]